MLWTILALGVGLFNAYSFLRLIASLENES